MVLRLKARESRSLPGQKSQFILIYIMSFLPKSKHKFRATDINAGWSSPVARQAHNLKVAGSNPAPATNITNFQKTLASNWPYFLLSRYSLIQTYSKKLGGCAFSILLQA